MKEKINKFDVELTPELLKRAQERVDHILNEGCARNGVSENFDPSIRPEWYSDERLKKAQAVCAEQFIAIGNSSLIGLLFVLQQPIGLIPLLATGQSKNVSKLFARYLNTLHHVKEWYESDPFDPNSKAYKSQHLVKIMHRNTSKLMNSKLSIYEFFIRMLEEQNKEANNNSEVSEEEIIKWIKKKDRTWVSQTDMVITQHAFIGILILEPYACGVHAATKQDLVEIAYMWRVIGYKIGIEDEFNLFNDLDYDFLYAVCKLMFEQVFLPFCENVSTTVGVRMAKCVTLGFRPISPYLRWKTYIRYWYKILNINAHKLNNLSLENDKYVFTSYPIKLELTEEEKKLQIANGYNGKYIVPNPEIPFEELKVDKFAEKFSHSLFLFHINIALKSHFLRKFVRKINERRAQKVLKKKEKIAKSMNKKYDEDAENQFPACPFAGEIKNRYYEFIDSMSLKLENDLLI